MKLRGMAQPKAREATGETPEPTPEPMTTTPDLLRGNVLLGPVYIEGVEAQLLSPYDRWALHVYDKDVYVAHNQRQLHPYDTMQKSRLWMPYNWRD